VHGTRTIAGQYVLDTCQYSKRVWVSSRVRNPIIQYESLGPLRTQNCSWQCHKNYTYSYTHTELQHSYTSSWLMNCLKTLFGLGLWVFNHSKLSPHFFACSHLPTQNVYTCTHDIQEMGNKPQGWSHKSSKNEASHWDTALFNQIIERPIVSLATTSSCSAVIFDTSYNL